MKSSLVSTGMDCAPRTWTFLSAPSRSLTFPRFSSSKSYTSSRPRPAPTISIAVTASAGGGSHSSSTSSCRSGYAPSIAINSASTGSSAGPTFSGEFAAVDSPDPDPAGCFAAGAACAAAAASGPASSPPGNKAAAACCCTSQEVCVFPVPVCPKKRTVAAPPSRKVSITGSATVAMIAGGGHVGENTLSTPNRLCTMYNVRPSRCT
mmetsp:Transcript_59721/g.159824  ORF Transcript_59721/g.159824 Transcript_59721/m.159824 type:complete len:207 (-) Transcript_59721:403-1023(-)